jgi:hypothetical protein
VPTPRSGVSCRPGMLTSDNWHQRVRVPVLAPSPPTRVSFPPVQGVAGSDPAVKACRAATPASAQPSVRPIQPHPSTRDDPAHRPPEPGACSATAASSSRPPAGPVQPSFGPPRQGSSPNLRIRSGLPGRAGHSTCADATRGCAESTWHRDTASARPTNRLTASTPPRRIHHSK